VTERTEPRRARGGSLRKLVVIGVVLAVGALGLAACGDDDDGTSAGGSTETTASDTGGESTDLAELLSIDPANAAKGETFKMGAVLALSGAGSFYGKTMSRGIDLAVKQIKAAGGPDIQVEYWDHKSGDAAAGKQAITEIISKGIGAKMSSYVDDLGAMLEDTAKNKIFTLDGGGGTSIFGQGIPYFWGTRAITPNDTLPGLLQWFKETYPDKKTVGLAGWDIGEPNNTTVKTDVLQKIKDSGLEFNGLYELTPVGSQDYAAVLPKIKANEPDLLLLGLYGQDPGSFLNQAETAGLKSVKVGFEFTPDGVNASKGTYDKSGWTFAYDWFDPEKPVSPLAKLFVSDFEKEYGEKPDFYAANFYENTMVMWTLISRVKAAGGDINSGEDLEKALESDLTVPSVYGGDDTTVGSYTLDATTHSVIKREMGVFEYKDGKVTAKAFFGIGGEGYRKA
jgi:ABC-type branched-subunit amino acid transport system substrate-binding protein